MLNTESRGVLEGMIIMAMRDGGYVVSEQSRDGLRPMMFACSTIDEALNYIKAEMVGSG